MALLPNSCRWRYCRIVVGGATDCCYWFVCAVCISRVSTDSLALGLLPRIRRIIYNQNVIDIRLCILSFYRQKGNQNSPWSRRPKSPSQSAQRQMVRGRRLGRQERRHRAAVAAPLRLRGRWRANEMTRTMSIGPLFTNTLRDGFNSRITGPDLILYTST